MAQNEARAREENEHRSAWFHGHERVAFVCECADPDCEELLSLDRETYSTLRATPFRFAVAVDHNEDKIERVIKRHEHWWLVEKSGEGAKVVKDRVETTEIIESGEETEVVKESVETTTSVKKTGDAAEIAGDEAADDPPVESSP